MSDDYTTQKELLAWLQHEWERDNAELTRLRAALAEAVAESDRLREALMKIRTGKVQEDNEHPLGEWASMGMRFHAIARAALAKETT